MNENESTETGPNCADCRFAIWQDQGYSNWTVEGTDFFCAKSLHPADGFDRWYGRDKRLDFAAECPGYEQGEGVHLDVDGEDEPSDEEKDLLNMRGVVTVTQHENYRSTRWEPNAR